MATAVRSNQLPYASGAAAVYDKPLAQILIQSRQGPEEFLAAAGLLKNLCALREAQFNLAAVERAHWLLRVYDEYGYGQARMRREFGGPTNQQQWQRIRDKAPVKLPPKEGDPRSEAAASCEKYRVAEGALRRARTLRAHMIKVASDASAGRPRQRWPGMFEQGPLEGSVRYWAEVFGVEPATVSLIGNRDLVEVPWLEDTAAGSPARAYRLTEPDPPPDRLDNFPDWDPASKPWWSFSPQDRAQAVAVPAPDYDTTSIVHVVMGGMRIGWLRPVFTSVGLRWGYQARDITGTVAPQEICRSRRADAVDALLAALDVVHT
jgi:hypothetical protein